MASDLRGLLRVFKFVMQKIALQIMNFLNLLKKSAVLQIYFILALAYAAAQETVEMQVAVPPPPKSIDASSETSGAVKPAAGKIPFSASKDFLFEYRMRSFAKKDYTKAVSALFSDFEKAVGMRIGRGEKGKVGLKVYSNSGAGIGTPKALVDAVIAQLEKRGYKKSEICLIDLSRRKLRDVGFLPRISALRSGAKDDYNGCPVADLESGKYYDKNWYYDNPLPPKTYRHNQSAEAVYDPELRKSMLPVPLYYGFDFWINLPVVTDMEGLGISGAIANVSVWNVSNNERFLNSPANAPMAAAEICAVPEMREGYLFSIISFEQIQIAGGAKFNAGVVVSEPYILLSSDIVALDVLAWNYINKYRIRRGFDPIAPMPPVFGYCEQLKLGSANITEKKRRFVPEN